MSPVSIPAALPIARAIARFSTGGTRRRWRNIALRSLRTRETSTRRKVSRAACNGFSGTTRRSLPSDAALAIEPEFAAGIANRGILLDTMGRHEDALKAYQAALVLDPDLSDGMHWIDRLLYNVQVRPPTVEDRMRYLEEQLALPEHRRVLVRPLEDLLQRPVRTLMPPRPGAALPEDGEAQDIDGQHPERKDEGDAAKEEPHPVALALLVPEGDAVPGNCPGGGEKDPVEQGIHGALGRFGAQ